MTDRIKVEVPSISYIVIMTAQISAPSAAAAALYHCYQHDSFSLNEAAMSATVMLYLT